MSHTSRTTSRGRKRTKLTASGYILYALRPLQLVRRFILKQEVYCSCYRRTHTRHGHTWMMKLGKTRRR